MQQTTCLSKIVSLNKRIKVVQGGTSAGKTYNIVLWLIDYAQTMPGTSISIVSETLPHLKKGALRDFLSIMKDNNHYKEDEYNRTNLVYTFGNGSYIEFFGVDDSRKVRGPRRDILFVNECNNINKMIYDELEVRTKQYIWLDFNPVSEFWVHDNVIGKENVDFIIVTYLDNEALDANIVKAIESRKGNKNWWRVYGEGKIGELDGQVYTDYEMIDDLPESARLIRYGLDFGYSNNPTGITAIYEHNDSYIIEEVCYRTGMSNKDIFKELDVYEEALIIADSAEPKSIDELSGYGLSVAASTKGPGSVLQGIQLLQDNKLLITSDSTNLIKELRNYVWKTDRNGKSLNVPIKEFDHLLDGARYAITDYVGLSSYKASDIKFL